MPTTNLERSLKKDDLLKKIDPSNVTFIVAEEDGSHINLLNDNTIIVKSTLSQLGLEAQSDNFIWANPSTIINLPHVLKYHHGAQSKIELVGGKLIDVSKKEQSTFLKKFVAF